MTYTNVGGQVVEEERTLKVEFRLDDGHQPIGWTQEFKMRGGWNPQQIAHLINKRWYELREEYMEMFFREDA